MIFLFIDKTITPVGKNNCIYYILLYWIIMSTFAMWILQIQFLHTVFIVERIPSNFHPPWFSNCGRRSLATPVSDLSLESHWYL